MRVTLKINPKFEQIIPPLTPEEFAQLEENILLEGKIINPIITWDEVIVDGHNRYKIALKHTEIPFSTVKKEFSCEDEVIIWICNNQLGRRNITDTHREYLIGKRYDAEKNMNGGDRKKNHQKSVGQNDPLISAHTTRARIAKENGITETAVRRADEFAGGVDIAEDISPGTKMRILSEEITPAKQDVRGIAKLSPEKRAEAVARLYYPKSTPHAENGEDRKQTTNSDSGSTVLESKPCQKASEENILGSMQGSVDLFISTYNNYFIQFPILKTEKKYRQITIDILETLKNYIEQLEGELK